MKRRNETLSYRQGRPKRMVIPSSEDFQNDSAYEWDWEVFGDASLWRIPRALPSSHVMASLQPATVTPHLMATRGLGMPLLQPLQHLFKGAAQSSTATTPLDKDNTQSQQQSLEMDAIDDATHSTLTKGQHIRFLQLQQDWISSSTWNDTKRKEYRKLRTLVVQEQSVYRGAMDQFFIQHKERFQVGLPSPFVSYRAEYAKLYKAQWTLKHARHYGKCRQVVSLDHLSRDAFLSKLRGKQRGTSSSSSSLTLDSFSSRVVHTEGMDKLPVVQPCDWDQTSILPFENSRLIPVLLLRDDTRAMELAQTHQVALVTTEETMKLLLHLAGDESWILPIVTRRNAKSMKHQMEILDLPIPQPSHPRDCLSNGMEEALYQQLGKETSTTSTFHHVYTLLTLPGKKKTRKVLVRSRNRLQDHENDQSIRLHIQLEYFVDRGTEEFTSHQKACWILDKVLQPSSRSMVARVCPKQAKIIQWQETSVAHALAGEKDAWIENRHLDPMNHWEALIDVLNATETLEEGEQLLCQTAGSYSVTVHKADTNDKSIDLEEEFDKADAVYTGRAALQRCARVWQWNQDRVPFTFPFKLETSTNNSK